MTNLASTVLVAPNDAYQRVDLLTSLSAYNQEEHKVTVAMVNATAAPIFLPKKALVAHATSFLPAVDGDEESFPEAETIDEDTVKFPGPPDFTDVQTTFDSMPEQQSEEDFENTLEEKLSHLDHHSAERVKEIIRRYIKPNQTLGLTDRVQFDIKLKPGAVPKIIRPRRVPFRLQPVMKEILEEMERKSIIRRAPSEWSSPVHLVPRKAVPGAPMRKRFRLVVDLRHINSNTVQESFEVPNVANLLQSLAGATSFTHLDLHEAYLSVKTTPNASRILGFSVVPFGSFVFLRMPFGAASAPSKFCELMEQLLGNVAGTLTFMDDVILTSQSFEEGLTRLENVLRILTEAGLCVNLSKSSFFQRSLEFLGRTVSVNGISVTPEKLAAVKNMKSPTNLKETRSVLGFFSFLRDSIKDYSRIAEPIYALLRLNTRFAWTAEAQDALDALKTAVTSAPTLAFPRFDKPFHLYTDASKYSAGGMLAQLDENGKPRPIGFFSCLLSSAQRHFTTTEKELFAAVRAVRFFSPIIYGYDTTLYTDHKPIVSLLTKMKTEFPSEKIKRWILVLAKHHLRVKFLKGASMPADALSRVVHKDGKDDTRLGLPKIINTENFEESDEETSVADEQAHEDEEEFEEERHTVNNVNVNPEEHPKPTFILDDIHRFQKRDPFCQEIVAFLQGKRTSNDLPPDVQRQLRAAVFRRSSEGVLYRHATVYKNGAGEHPVTQVVVPRHMRREFFRNMHLSPFSCHSGYSRTLKTSLQYFWFPTIATDFYKWIEACPECQKNKRCFPPPRYPYGQHILQKMKDLRPFQVLSFDHVTGMDNTGSQYTSILTFTCYFSGYLWAYPCTSMSAKVVAKHLVRDIICNFGIPEVILSDQFSSYIGELFSEVCKLLGCRRLLCQVFSPWQNSVVERAHSTLMTMLRCMVADNKKKWAQILPLATYAYNTTYSSSRRSTPFFLLHSRHPRVPILPFTEPDSLKNPEAIGLSRDLQEAYARLLRQMEKQTRLSNKNRPATSSPVFPPNSFVLIKREGYPPHVCRKLYSLYDHPHRVVKRLSECYYLIEHVETKRQQTIHMRRLKKYVPPLPDVDTHNEIPDEKQGEPRNEKNDSDATDPPQTEDDSNEDDDDDDDDSRPRPPSLPPPHPPPQPPHQPPTVHHDTEAEEHPGGADLFEGGDEQYEHLPEAPEGTAGSPTSSQEESAEPATGSATNSPFPTPEHDSPASTPTRSPATVEGRRLTLTPPEADTPDTPPGPLSIAQRVKLGLTRRLPHRRRTHNNSQ
jgi:hypothetical protein